MCRCLRFTAALAVLFSATACSQQSKTPRETAEEEQISKGSKEKETAKPPAVNKDGADSAAVSSEAVVRKVAEFYKAAKTVQVREEQVMHVQMQKMDNKTTTNRTVVAEKPNRLAMRGEGGMQRLDLVSDGEIFFTYLPMMKTYTEEEAPESIEHFLTNPMITAMGGGMGAFVVHLLSEDPHRRLMEGVTDSKYVGRETLDGIDMHRLKFVQDQFDWEMWVNAQGDPLISQVSADMTKNLARAQNAFQGKNMKMTSVTRFKDWKFNEPLDSNAFVFTPPEGAEKTGNLFGGNNFAEEANGKRAEDKPAAPKPAAPKPEGLETAWTQDGTYVSVTVDPKQNMIVALRSGGKCDLFDAAGGPQGSFEIEGSVTRLRPANLTGSEKSELLGFGAWGKTVTAIAPDGSVLWTESGGQGVDDVWATNLDGDGGDEVIVGYNGGTGLHVFDRNGVRRWKYTEIANVWHVTAGDATGDGKIEVVTTSATGQVHLFDVDGDQFKNLDSGIYANMVRMGRVAAEDKADTIFVVGRRSGGGRIVALDGAGTELWSIELPGNSNHCDSMAISPIATWAAVGLRGGLVSVIDLAQGKIIANALKQGRTPQVSWATAPDEDTPLLLVATGRALRAYHVKPEAREDSEEVSSDVKP